MNGGPEGSLRPILLGDGGFDLRGWDSLNIYFSVRAGLHFVGFEMFKPKLHLSDLAHLGSDVVWIGEGAFVLGVDCWLKATSHRCRRDLCRYSLWGCSGVDDDIPVSL